MPTLYSFIEGSSKRHHLFHEIRQKLGISQPVTLKAGNYLGAQHTTKGVRFQRNLCLGVYKFWEPHIDVIQNHIFRRMKIGSKSLKA